jgi:hypothetical protein
MIDIDVWWPCGPRDCYFDCDFDYDCKTMIIMIYMMAMIRYCVHHGHHINHYNHSQKIMAII